MRSRPTRHVAAIVTGTLAAVAVMAPSLSLADTGVEHEQGKAVYTKWCAPCHAPGIIHPGTHALETKYQGVKSGVILEWTDLPASYVEYMVRHGMSVMPQFRKTEITDSELKALAAYLSRNTP